MVLWAFIPHSFMEILQRYAKLFWVLWAWLVTLIQNDSITLLKTSMFICMQKIHLIIHFFLTILHFKELDWPAAFWPTTWDPKLYQICWSNVNNNIRFHYRLLPKKLGKHDNIFQEIPKTLFWAHSWPFCPSLGQKWVFLEKRAVSFSIFD